MLRWLQGKKTYLMGLAGTALVIAEIAGLAIPGWGWAAALVLGGTALRAGIQKAENAANGVRK